MFHRKRWFQGHPIHGASAEDIAWFSPDGVQMEEDHWNDYFAKSLAVFLNGNGIHTLDEHGKQIVDDNFYIMFNAHYGSIDYKLPESKYGERWQKVVDTANDLVGETDEWYDAGGTVTVKSRSMILLQSANGELRMEN